MKTKHLNHQSLEAITYLTSLSRVKLLTLTSLLKQLRQFLGSALNLSNEPRISLVQRPSGQQWHVYDPATGYRTYLQSEQEVRIWLEQRYNRFFL
jgi:hypothetical protein